MKNNLHRFSSFFYTVEDLIDHAQFGTISISKTNYHNTYKAKLISHIAGLKMFTEDIQYDFKCYHLKYSTNFEGERILVSGVVCIPINDKPKPFLLAQHPTIFDNGQAPTSSFAGFELFASMGFIVLIPDLIGFGASVSKIHPYYHKSYSAQTVCDMLHSTKIVFDEFNIDYLNDIYLVGYSEGGYVSLAAHEMLQRQNENVKASAIGAGCYNIYEMMRMVVRQPIFTNPSFIANVLYSYNTLYWKKPLDEVFNPKYAELIPILLGGHYNRLQINQKLESNLSKLIQPDLLEILLQESDRKIISPFKENSLDFVPVGKLKMYHSQEDLIIPICDTQQIYDKFCEICSIKPEFQLMNGDHKSAALPMMKDAVQWFKTLI